MNVPDLSRWRFGITTVYHFILVPLTIGLAPLLAIMQTASRGAGHHSRERRPGAFGRPTPSSATGPGAADLGTNRSSRRADRAP